MSAPTWGDPIKFCEADKWEVNRKTKHIVFKKVLPDSSELRTQASRGKDQQAIGQGLFHFILREELLVSEDEFWKAIESRQPAERPGHPPAVPPRKPNPQLVHQLEQQLRLGAEEIAKLSHDEAVRLLDQHHARAADPDTNG